MKPSSPLNTVTYFYRGLPTFFTRLPPRVITENARAHGGQHPHIVLQLGRISSMPDAGGPTGGFFNR
jgi:hypothetical protein